jgi:hypothetical protein
MNSNRKRLYFFDSTSQSKKRNKKVIVTKLQDANEFCNSLGLVIEKVIINTRTEVRPLTESNLIITREKEDEEESNEMKLIKCLKIRDSTMMSKRKYMNMRKELDWCHFPTYRKLLSIQNKINKIFDIKKNERGAYCNVFKKIELACKNYLKINEFILENNEFIIKISGDGTSINKKNVNVFTFTFTIINDTKNNKSSDGHYLLGINFI